MYAGIIAQILISEWIWGLTWVLYYNLINILFMILLLKFFLGIRIVPAVLISCSAQLAAFLFFNLFVIGILVFGFGIEYDVSKGWDYIPSPFYASFILGIIYATLQCVFFWIFNKYYKLNVSWACAIAFLSNSLTVLLINLFPPKL